jgi:hypothetical protein
MSKWEKQIERNIDMYYESGNAFSSSHCGHERHIGSKTTTCHRQVPVVTKEEELELRRK